MRYFLKQNIIYYSWNQQIMKKDGYNFLNSLQSLDLSGIKNVNIIDTH